MWLIIGLGNPGDEYAGTRHNVGFMVLDVLAKGCFFEISGKTKTYLYGRGFIEKQDALLIKPLTFMNRSGIAVMDALRKSGDPDTLDILVVQDDIDLDTGVIRIRKAGSSGGHKGIESIIQTLGTRDFLRLKIGIGRSDRIPVEEYVLRKFTKQERPLIDEAVVKAAEAIHLICSKGMSEAQNVVHGKGR